MVARTYQTVAVGDETLAVADSICKALIAKQGYVSRFNGAAGSIKTLAVLGVKVRMIYRSQIDYSLGTDEWSVRFRHKPLPVGTVLRGCPDAFLRDMTVFKMIGAPYTLD